MPDVILSKAPLCLLHCFSCCLHQCRFSYGIFEEKCTLRDTRAEDSSVIASGQTYRQDASCPAVSQLSASIFFLDKIKDGYLKDATVYRDLPPQNRTELK